MQILQAPSSAPNPSGTAFPGSTTRATAHQLQLQKRMQGPQRHRLLQGYPLPPLMKELPPGQTFEPVQIDPTRPLIVGILPHAACNPSVQGCGYCTFPHEDFRLSEVRQTVEAVCLELQQSPLQGRAVEALYFGGGTANLTPPDLFDRLCQIANRVFDLRGAEITLEGAPVYFSSRREALLDLLETHFGEGSVRLSMGVQSFQDKQIAAMGRQHLGSPEAVARAVQAAQRRSMTTSADLLIHLPGQTLEEMLEDVERASDLGFSQICLYHLVLFRGLGTPWSRDRGKLASLPDNPQAFANWLQVRQRLLELGYRQKTLTNFERQGHYRYEECSYQPARFDGVGFGPEALSCFTDLRARMAVKWMNQARGSDYRQAMQQAQGARSRCFVYGEIDLKLLFLTRSLARLAVSRALYRQTYGSDLVADFQEPWQALREAGLVEWDAEELRLSERGMFFSDSVVGLLAADRIAELRRSPQAAMEDAPVFRMG